MNLKKIQKIESKERILNVASRLFKKNGYAATGIDQIMMEAGLTAGAFYAHFKSKTDLLEQSIEHSMKHSMQILTRGLEDIPKEEKIKTVMSRYISILHRDIPEKGCVLPSLASEIYRGTKKSNQIIMKYINSWVHFLKRYLPDELTEDQKKQKALSMISQAVGAVLLSRMLVQTDLSEEIITASLAK